MSDPAAEFSQFLAKSDSQKLEDFERSTIKVVLRGLGLDPRIINRLYKEQEASITWDWFNDTYGLPVTYDSTRCFNFNISDVFLQPSKCPVIKIWYEKPRKNVALIFKAYEYGRMVMSDKPMSHTHIMSIKDSSSSPVYISRLDPYLAAAGNPLLQD